MGYLDISHYAPHNNCMKIYTCKICGVNSDSVKFYAGVSSRCAECHKARARENRAENLEYYRAYDAKRFKEDPRVLARNKRYQATDAGAASMVAAKEKWAKQNPEKRAAHFILKSAVKYGRAHKPLTCESCGAGGRIHGHHHDYTKPLDVAWLCPKCHTAEHKRIDAMKPTNKALQAVRDEIAKGVTDQNALIDAACKALGGDMKLAVNVYTTHFVIRGAS